LRSYEKLLLTKSFWRWKQHLTGKKSNRSDLIKALDESKSQCEAMEEKYKNSEKLLKEVKNKVITLERLLDRQSLLSLDSNSSFEEIPIEKGTKFKKTLSKKNESSSLTGQSSHRTRLYR